MQKVIQTTELRLLPSLPMKAMKERRMKTISDNFKQEICAGD